VRGTTTVAHRVDGIQHPAFIEVGPMPAFGRALTNDPFVDLAAYRRQRSAPDQPAWSALPEAVRRASAAFIPTKQGAGSA
jgi:nicotinate dehydrogenase subunit B